MTYKHKITGTQVKLAEDGKYYFHNCSIGIPKQFIEDSRMWEKEYGYEILIFKSNRSLSYTPAIQKDGTYLDYPVMHCDGGGATLEWMLKEPEYYIYSIKRLNDGEVFSIGDKVSERLSDKKGFIIESFSIYDDKLIVGIKKNCTHTTANLRFLDKVKEPILVTEDGVELFGGESIYGVTDDFQLCYTSIATKENVQSWRIFAKKENAETFIKENKPQYSLNDIKETVKKLNCFGTTLIEYLEKQ